jgi:NAD(P)-dependent dehydrogenase (short-subunit alcohol dehydrogenase family)
MAGSVVLITGTSSGIGLATAIAAARAGHRVVATMRDVTRNADLLEAARAAGVELDIRELDVTDESEIETCIAGVATDYARLDAVINNAGVGHIGTIELESVGAVHTVMNINFFSVVMITRAAMPYLRAARGNLITVTSVGGAIGQPFNEAYCAAKFAVEGFMESLTPVAATVGVKVTVIEPGPVSSKFVENIGADFPTMIRTAGPYAPALQHYLTRTQTQFASANAQDPAVVGELIADVLAVTPAPARVVTSEYAKRFVGTKYADLDGSAVQEMTWGWVTGS